MFLFSRAPTPRDVAIHFRGAMRDVRNTLRDAQQHPGTLPFIIASFLYQDAIGTIVGFMALYAVKAMHFAAGSETTLFLVLTLPAIVGSYIAGRPVDRIGSRRPPVLSIVPWSRLPRARFACPPPNPSRPAGPALV